mmetsp:Transcript_28632/g.31799  ORF Transcript_28632/g.31799 Transcript_28632/m.31799 type:complete len:143 (+) Transcript_28632:311-739(+)
MTSIYYRAAKGAIIVFDLTNEKTFKAVDNWYNDIKQKVDTSNIPTMLLGNKVDLITNTVQACVSDADVDSLAGEKEFIGWNKTSAKKNLNIDKAMEELVTNIVAQMDIGREPDQDHEIVRVSSRRNGSRPTQANSEPGCCWK